MPGEIERYTYVSRTSVQYANGASGCGALGRNQAQNDRIWQSDVSEALPYVIEDLFRLRGTIPRGGRLTHSALSRLSEVYHWEGSHEQRTTSCSKRMLAIACRVKI